MLPVTKVLSKVVVAKFYERNAGLFLFVFFFMFGIVESTQIINYHLSLIYGVLSSPIFLLTICTVWLLYMLKCLQFASSQLTKPENTFLFQLARLEGSKQFRCILVAIMLIDAPVLAYSSLIVIIAFKEQLYIQAIEVIAFHIALILLASWQIVHQINSQHREIKFLKLPTIQWNQPKPFPFFYLGQLTTQLPTAFFITKVFSFFSIYGFLQIPLDHYENRVALMGLLFGLTAHAVIVFEFRKFEERNLLFMRNLPLSSVQRFVQLAIVYFLLLIPESVILVVNHTQLIDVLGIYLFGVGILMVSHCHLYVELDNDKHIQWTLGLFLISFMLALFKIYWIELMVLWLLAFHYLNKNFYQFEINSE